MRSNSDVDRTILTERGTRGRAHAGRVRALVAHPSRKDANGFGRKVVAHRNPSLRVVKFTTTDIYRYIRARPAGWDGSRAPRLERSRGPPGFDPVRSLLNCAEVRVAVAFFDDALE